MKGEPSLEMSGKVYAQGPTSYAHAGVARLGVVEGLLALEAAEGEQVTCHQSGRGSGSPTFVSAKKIEISLKTGQVTLTRPNLDSTPDDR